MVVATSNGDAVRGILGGGFKVGYRPGPRSEGQAHHISPRHLVRGDVGQGVVTGDFFRGQNGGALRADYMFRVEKERLLPVRSARAKAIVDDHARRSDLVLPPHPLPFTTAVDLLEHWDAQRKRVAAPSLFIPAQPSRPQSGRLVHRDAAPVAQRRRLAAPRGPTLEDVCRERRGIRSDQPGKDGKALREAQGAALR